MLAFKSQPRADQRWPIRWGPLEEHAEQQRLWRSKARFRVIPAGRRSGKTELAKRFLVLQAIYFDAAIDGRFVCCAPTFNQAKKIFWNDLKALIPNWALKHPDNRRKSIKESEMVIYLWNGAKIEIAGMDVPERIEGSPLDGIILDEYGNMKENAWKLHVRPALYTRGREPGWAWLTGVPEGRNHYYKIAMDAKKRNNWGLFTWVSADILPAEEIKAAKEELDPISYSQEYEATFASFEGRAYYSFDMNKHVEYDLYEEYYDTKKDLHICFDFNVEPGVAAIIQEIEYEGRNEHCADNVTAVIGEVYIPLHSTTVKVCNKIIHDWGEHEGRVYLYGDATGGNRGSAKIAGSDWEIIDKMLRPVFTGRLFNRVQSSNPPERIRVNSVNARFSSTTGTVRLLVDGSRAEHVVDDFDTVHTLKGGSGEIDKDSDKTKTHISDAVGYYIWRRYPIQDGKLQTIHI